MFRQPSVCLSQQTQPTTLESKGLGRGLEPGLVRRSRAEAADTEALVGLLTGPGFRTQGQEAKASAPGEEPNQAGRPGQDREARTGQDRTAEAAWLTCRRVWGRGEDRQKGCLRNSLTNVIPTLGSLQAERRKDSIPSLAPLGQK